MSKIYLPNEITQNNCAYVYDTNTIRVYEEVPRYNATINYTDYFINSHYVTRSGSTTFGNYNTIQYNCIDYTNFTTNYAYSNNMMEVVVISAILIGVAWFMVRTILRRFLYGPKRYH